MITIEVLPQLSQLLLQRGADPDMYVSRWKRDNYLAWEYCLIKPANFATGYYEQRCSVMVDRDEIQALEASVDDMIIQRLLSLYRQTFPGIKVRRFPGDPDGGMILLNEDMTMKFE